VAYRQVAKWWLYKQRSLLGNASNVYSRNMQPVYRQRIGKHVSKTMELLSETVFSIRSVQSGYKKDNWVNQFSQVLSSEEGC
jgi:hypothetical protein